MSERRTVRIEHLSEAIEEAERLLSCGYVRHGNWSLGQICRHLRLVQDPSIDGYPRWMSLFAFLRPLMRRMLLPKVLSPDPPEGIRTLGRFEPGQETDDRKEVERFAASVKRFLSHRGSYRPHPAFGHLNREELEQIHSSHAAHHLRFLSPKSGVGGTAT